MSEKAFRSFIKAGLAGADEWDIAYSWTPPFNKEGGLLQATVKDSLTRPSSHRAGRLRFRDDNLVCDLPPLKPFILFHNPTCRQLDKRAKTGHPRHVLIG